MARYEASEVPYVTILIHLSEFLRFCHISIKKNESAYHYDAWKTGDTFWRCPQLACTGLIGI